ncbi:MAG: hypothetical protein NTV05_05350 [Acidobacteria bacterium]|nr:hypothetical protein [Acidobacteriota bacterium]
MQLAAIDIGTNSLHMILVRVAPDGSFTVVGREKDMVRLGAGGLEGRPLGDAAMAAASAGTPASKPASSRASRRRA